METTEGYDMSDSTKQELLSRWMAAESDLMEARREHDTLPTALSFAQVGSTQQRFDEVGQAIDALLEAR